jgi:hypothetical protein
MSIDKLSVAIKQIYYLRYFFNLFAAAKGIFKSRCNGFRKIKLIGFALDMFN